ncbi:hypothetical protein BT63DRAFT_458846 [Microthyrium microscopicum]|uniref:BTB domain-containing protein n=1 Tax=Microthyrium microscopicum TaxID=703497 RepID=A0A6A6U2B6_9PEZI|nr:hypothetical protein BT63DRAFT_458846 [Microthyrium microscopicum]
MSSADEPKAMSEGKADPNGDLYVRVEQRDGSDEPAHYLVSAQVLSTASDDFKAMISEHSSVTGQRALRNNLPMITIPNSNVAAMGCIFWLLHRHIGLNLEELSHKPVPCLLLEVYIEARNRDVFVPGIKQWITERLCAALELPALSNKDIADLTTVAWYLEDESKFEQLTLRAMKSMPADFLSRWERLRNRYPVPSSIPVAIRKQIRDSSEKLLETLHLGVELLEENTYVYDTLVKLCRKCGRQVEGDATKCQTCDNSDVIPGHCTKDVRVSLYFQAIRKVNLWPKLVRFREDSFSKLVHDFDRLKDDKTSNCARNQGCPLFGVLRRVREAVEKLGDDLKGLSLSDFRDHAVEMAEDNSRIVSVNALRDNADAENAAHTVAPTDSPVELPKEAPAETPTEVPAEVPTEAHTGGSI